MAAQESTSVSHRLCARLAELSYDDIPDAVIDHTRRMVLDTFGVAWAGAGAPGSADIEELMLAGGGGGKCRAWASGRSLDATGAAFLNSVHAAALDYDSVFEKGSVHPDIVSIPVAWALSEETGGTGKDFLAAIAVGNEVMCRLAAAATENRGWFNTALFGGFGAAAAAAKILGLSVGQTRDALGLVLSQAGGSQQALIEKTMAKRVQSGFAARAGVFAAQLAGRGVTAPAECFEGKFGFYRLYCDGDPAPLLDGFGDDYLCLGAAVKKFPSCTANHVPIDAVIGIVEELDLAPDDIRSIRTVISPFAHGLVGAPFDPRENPQVAAQFSLEYSIACAALRRRLTVDDIQEDAIKAPEIRDLIGRIAIEVDEGNTGKFAPAEVVVESARHGTIRRRQEHVPGTPELRLTASQIEDKFRACIAAGARPLDQAQTGRLIERLTAIADIADMSTFFDSVDCHER
jgi:2-methylcitrate dehydratase PrpD